MIGVEQADLGGVWLDVVAAVDYVAATHRPGFTVWDALEEALRWWMVECLDPRHGFAPRAAFEVPWDDPDPLRSTIEGLAGVVAPVGTPGGHSFPDALTAALTVWTGVMADEFNDGHHFAQPRARRAASL